MVAKLNHEHILYSGGNLLYSSQQGRIDLGNMPFTQIVHLVSSSGGSRMEGERAGNGSPGLSLFLTFQNCKSLTNPDKIVVICFSSHGGKSNTIMPRCMGPI